MSFNALINHIYIPIFEVPAKGFRPFSIGVMSVSTISFSCSGNTLTTGEEFIEKGTKGKMKDIKEVRT